jgi:hypothetical protein
MSSVVVLSPEELRALVREAVAEALRDALEPREPSAPITDSEHADARARWQRKMAGRR